MAIPKKANLSIVEATLLARADPESWLRQTMAWLEEWGLLLDSDPALPSWPSLVVDRPLRGSWWSDPDVQLIYDMGGRLVAHPDVLHVVLVSGKLTCVHRRLGAELLAVALADDDWKFHGLHGVSSLIHERLKTEPRLFADDPGLAGGDVKANGRAIRNLEGRMLCAGGSSHTTRGSHAKFAVRWEEWMAEHGLARPAMSSEEGMHQLDECLDRLNRDFGGHGKLPWWRATRPS